MTKAAPRLVHIFGKTPHHYHPMRAFFSSLRFENEVEQVFWAWSKENQTEAPGVSLYENGNKLLVMMKAEPESTRFVFHGLFDRSIWPRLAFSSLLKRSGWVCWGAEIYQYRADQVPFKKRVAFWFHKVIARRLAHILALTKGDAELIKELLGAPQARVLPYPLIGADAKPSEKTPGQPLKVLVGNSASPANNHIDALKWLEKFKDQNLQVVVPLNYGGPRDYVEKVLEDGNKRLGDKFSPVTAMLSKAEYDQLLADIDIAVFSHQRQQGLYVVYSMFLYGRKMFLRGDTSSYAMLKDSGFHVNQSEKIPALSWQDFSGMPDGHKDQNKKLMQDTFSEQALQPKWLDFCEQLLIHGGD
jgi:dTDP-N-acetylfucosamine:lipid II N-acetylfucosaminyltransferase